MKHARDNPGAGIDGILFDLDGTLVDTAPDMVAALLTICEHHKLPKPDPRIASRFVSDGSVALLKLVLTAEQLVERDTWVQRYLDVYENCIAENSKLYPGIQQIIDRCDQQKIPWGIVTNKPEYLSRLLIQGLTLDERCACLIGGDTLPTRKPNPEPLLHAARLLGLEPASTIYIGDHQRDIEAASSAGMTSYAAAWGYLKADDDPSSWGAHKVCDNAHELSRALWKNQSELAC